MLIPWWLASMVSNGAIIYTESVNRHSTSLPDALAHTWWAILLAQACLWVAWNGAPHWFMAWAVFSIGNAAMRAGAVYFTGQPVGSWSIVLGGIGVMLAGAFLMKTGLR